MAVEVIVYQIPGHPRSTAVTQAMAEGIRRCGDKAILWPATRYIRPEHQVAVFYGLAGRLETVLSDYRKSAELKALYIDLGYWGRKDGGRFAGYHKISVNDRHPTAYFQARKHDASRVQAFPQAKVAPWRSGGGHILVAGMGPKGAKAEGFLPLQWERLAIEEIRKHSGRPIHYRPKPNWPGSPAIPGAERRHHDEPLELALRGCHAVVAHHSNAVVEGLIAGVPGFTLEGVAAPMALADLAHIEKPLLSPDREQWAADIAWCQWSVAEMAQGLPWRHMKDEGLIP